MPSVVKTGRPGVRPCAISPTAAVAQRTPARRGFQLPTSFSRWKISRTGCGRLRIRERPTWGHGWIREGDDPGRGQGIGRIFRRAPYTARVDQGAGNPHGAEDQGPGQRVLCARGRSGREGTNRQPHHRSAGVRAGAFRTARRSRRIHCPTEMPREVAGPSTRPLDAR
jgi:hypothetical protein